MKTVLGALCFSALLTACSDAGAGPDAAGAGDGGLDATVDASGADQSSPPQDVTQWLDAAADRPVSVDAASDVVAVDASVPDVPSTPVTITLFDAADLHYTSTSNTRSVDATVSFPDASNWASVSLRLTLACPSGRCDAWDRVGSLSVLESGPSPDGGTLTTELEFARFVTPYRVGGTWTLDVTDLQPLLRGPRQVRAFIDTWVGPGSSFGDGWLLTASLTFTPGTPSRRPIAAIPLGWSSAVYGDPARTIASQLPARAVRVPAGTGSAAVIVTTTGHGQGNRNNCAEFCSRQHTVRVDTTDYTAPVWRGDCASNPIDNQQGTWRFPRAGWCPGDVVTPRHVDLGTTLAPGTDHTFAYDVEAYENTCRPDAPTCANCALGTGCAYDDGSHTEPTYRVTGYAVFYAP